MKEKDIVHSPEAIAMRGLVEQFYKGEIDINGYKEGEESEILKGELSYLLLRKIFSKEPGKFTSTTFLANSLLRHFGEKKRILMQEIAQENPHDSLERIHLLETMNFINLAINTENENLRYTEELNSHPRNTTEWFAVKEKADFMGRMVDVTKRVASQDQ